MDEVIPLIDSNEQKQRNSISSTAEQSNRFHKQDREIKRLGRVVTASCQFSVVLAIVAATILVSAFILAKAVSPEFRIYGFTIIGIIFLGIFAVLVIAARKDATILLIFTNLALLITGFSLGISACLFYHIVAHSAS